MQLRYKGPLTAVEIAATGQTVARGETVNVEDETVAEALLVQTDTWTQVAAPKSTAASKTSTPPEGD